MKTLTWQEAYSNLILDDFVEDKIRDLENAKSYRELNYIKGKNDPEENKKKPKGTTIRVIESEKYKKMIEDCPYTNVKGTKAMKGEAQF
jgi:hypothetical protein